MRPGQETSVAYQILARRQDGREAQSEDSCMASSRAVGRLNLMGTAEFKSRLANNKLKIDNLPR